MKKVIFLCAAFLSWIPGKGQELIISGQIKNAKAGSSVMLTYYNNPVEWKEITAGQDTLDGQGNFTIHCQWKNPRPASLEIAGQQTDMFLFPGDSLQLTADYNRFDESLNYTGTGSEHNNYLASEMLEEIDKKANSYNRFSDGDQYKIFMDSLKQANIQFLITHNSPAFRPEFRSYIQTNIQYRFVNPLWMFRISYDPVKKAFSEKQLPESYFDFLKYLNLDDQQAIENSKYTVSLLRYLGEYNVLKGDTTIPDSLPDVKKKQLRILKQYNQRKNLFQDKILDYELTIFLKDNLKKESFTDRVIVDSLLNDYRSSCKNEEYKSIIDALYSRSAKLEKGNAAPSFALLNTEGKISSLSDYRGKVVYIDFWATWCLPCRAEMPASRKLTEEFKKEEVVFIYINLLDDKEQWKKMTQEIPGGVHLFADREQSKILQEQYNFDGIPHYVLLDRKGNFLHANAERPAEAAASIKDALKY